MKDLLQRMYITKIWTIRIKVHSRKPLQIIWYWLNKKMVIETNLFGSQSQTLREAMELAVMSCSNISSSSSNGSNCSSSSSSSSNSFSSSFNDPVEKNSLSSSFSDPAANDTFFEEISVPLCLDLDRFRVGDKDDVEGDVKWWVFRSGVELGRPVRWKWNTKA